MARPWFCIVFVAAAAMGCRPNPRPPAGAAAVPPAIPTQPEVTFEGIDEIPSVGQRFAEAELQTEPFDGLTRRVVGIEGKDAQIVTTSKNSTNPVGQLVRRDGTVLSDRELRGPLVHLPWNAVLVRAGGKQIAIDLDTGEERSFEVESRMVTRLVPAGDVVWIVSPTHYARVTWPPPPLVRLVTPLPFEAREYAGRADGSLELYEFEGPDMKPVATYVVDESMTATHLPDRLPLSRSASEQVAQEDVLLRGLNVKRASFSDRVYKIEREGDWLFVAGLNVTKTVDGLVFDALPSRGDFGTRRGGVGFNDGRTMGPVHVIDTRTGEITAVQPSDCPFVSRASFALSNGAPFVVVQCSEEEGVVRLGPSRLWAPGYEATQQLGPWFGAVSWIEKSSQFFLRDVRKAVSGPNYRAVGPNLLLHDDGSVYLLTDGQTKRRKIAHAPCPADSEAGDFTFRDSVLWWICGVRATQDHGDYRSVTTELRQAWIIDLREERVWKTSLRPVRVDHDSILLAVSPTFRSHGDQSRITLRAARRPSSAR